MGFREICCQERSGFKAPLLVPAFLPLAATEYPGEWLPLDPWWPSVTIGRASMQFSLLNAPGQGVSGLGGRGVAGKGLGDTVGLLDLKCLGESHSMEHGGPPPLCSGVVLGSIQKTMWNLESWY